MYHSFLIHSSISSLIINCQPHYQHLLAAVSEPVNRLISTCHYYPVNIPTPAANTLYQITNMKITGLGSDSPDKLVEKGTISVSITVTDWSTGFSKEVEY